MYKQQLYLLLFVLPEKRWFDDEAMDAVDALSDETSEAAVSLSGLVGINVRDAFVLRLE